MLSINSLRDEFERIFRRSARTAADGGWTAQQAGTLPYRLGERGREVLLVTSKRTARWVLPKGWPKAGESLAQSAARETYEEAGVTGVVEPVELGRFVTTRLRMGSRAHYVVVIYPLRVELELADWPERQDRRRQWFSLAEAKTLVAAEQRGLLRALERSVPPTLADAARDTPAIARGPLRARGR
jgi:8-oxo-dGTP pyrophosphatase MutT (NUDIX family)